MTDRFGNVFEDLKRSTWIKLHSRLSEHTNFCELSIDLQKLSNASKQEFMIRMEDSGLGETWRQGDALLLRVKAGDSTELQGLLFEIVQIVRSAESRHGRVA